MPERTQQWDVMQSITAYIQSQISVREKKKKKKLSICSHNLHKISIWYPKMQELIMQSVTGTYPLNGLFE